MRDGILDPWQWRRLPRREIRCPPPATLAWARIVGIELGGVFRGDVSLTFGLGGKPSGPASILRLIGAVLSEANDEWQTSNRYRMVEAFSRIDKGEIAPVLRITTKAA
jgi:hypothetical protein